MNINLLSDRFTGSGPLIYISVIIVLKYVNNLVNSNNSIIFVLSKEKDTIKCYVKLKNLLKMKHLDLKHVELAMQLESVLSVYGESYCVGKMRSILTTEVAEYVNFDDFAMDVRYPALIAIRDLSKDLLDLYSGPCPEDEYQKRIDMRKAIKDFSIFL